MVEELDDIVEGYEKEAAFHEALDSTPMINTSLVHLTLSHEIMEFLKSDDLLKSLVPLADQICATNYLDDRGVALHKAMIDSAILHLKIYGDEDNQMGHANLRTARQYLHSLADGCRKGYRGRLATEMRRTIKTEKGGSPERRGWRR